MVASFVTSRQRTQAQGRGFTLVELMVVVVVISILAAVGYPSYAEHLVRGQIGEATKALADSRMAMEQFYLSSRTYTGGPCSAATVQTFSIACAITNSGTQYTVTATGSGATSGFIYTIDHHGTQTTTLSNGWGTGTYPCWVDRKGRTC